jgi:hypothetical protein
MLNFLERNNNFGKFSSKMLPKTNSGMLLYNTYMKHWRYHSLIIFGNLLICGISLMGVMIYTRFNRAIGIPDHVFVLGGAVLASVVHQWLWLPGVVLLSQLCPQGVEATM